MAALEEGGGVWRGGQDVKRRRARAAAAAAPEPRPGPGARAGALPALGSPGSRRRGAVAAGPAAVLLPGGDEAAAAAAPEQPRPLPTALPRSQQLPAPGSSRSRLTRASSAACVFLFGNDGDLGLPNGPREPPGPEILEAPARWGEEEEEESHCDAAASATVVPGEGSFPGGVDTRVFGWSWGGGGTRDQLLSAKLQALVSTSAGGASLYLLLS